MAGVMNAISMPATFLEVPGAPREKWCQWIKSFEMHLVAIDGTQYSDVRKQALLYNCLGAEGRRLFDNILPVVKPEGVAQDDWNVYVEAKKRMEEYFDTSISIIMERHNFYYRYQAPGESVEAYVATLRMLASTCAFINTNEMIRDQVVMRMTCIKAQEKLLCHKNPSLDRVISTIKSSERSAIGVKHF